jgi:hypothetical protein
MRFAAKNLGCLTGAMKLGITGDVQEPTGNERLEIVVDVQEPVGDKRAAADMIHLEFV